MENTQHLKKRLKSVANINKITKAMELVAATKMRRSQEIALASRPYALTALDLLANLTLIEKSTKFPMPELLQQRKIKRVLFVLISSDKGLAGSFNSAVFKKFEQHMERDKEKYRQEEKFFVAVGEKAFQYLSKKGIAVLRKFVQAGDYTTAEQVKPLTDFIVKGYLKTSAPGGASWDRVVIFSTHFRSALKQEPHVRKALPIQFDHLLETIKEITPSTGKFADIIKEQNITFGGEIKDIKEYLIEPSPEAVLEDLAKHLLFMQMYHLILEANASEHSARRMAMKTASDNASDLSETLNLQYNKSRQSAITKEIIEITAGSEALS
ncbi:MAG: ATP synthase F1 subunit gamma [Candidatus Staskawiczbacteria bacterium RIFCSPLOWO2_01_FULL_40_39]|uniref:ATP synthase gamma chain n=1 Tax=Candidatus Staskawiczbacteria bacterium RIFCSPHIGHO2_01_FULL_39_25 TaxID=1802202 RepID=A0A1G2HNV4_9BACT|nr:MAG: ATP synthase F1 subunit gamma [Candidatus Staskawiczbacteria bacterium RIFCSPHIGHO2_01_FULL_39_25]OGZ73369.1 MAG: ATP synthase F1 subunit gamma [Candidatus Staskawiczbacteria bacterium RIFCSPLOWO2_01_FULL_40_39]OGZ75967.1 MAG: ATP synthase F1 subunit gamma [Candidatus Staskawiczbacteria bacterium RIFCSPLOWO2_02_FULL_39_8]